MKELTDIWRIADDQELRTLACTLSSEPGGIGGRLEGERNVEGIQIQLNMVNWRIMLILNAH